VPSIITRVRFECHPRLRPSAAPASGQTTEHGSARFRTACRREARAWVR
jgi:hypothetical protein